MQDRSTSRTPIAAFALPPHAPADVATAVAAFDRVADQYAATKGEIDDVQDAAKQALADAKRAVVDAAKAGKPSKVQTVKVEADAAAKIDDLQAKVAALAVAVDETGNDLAVAVAASKTEWIATLASVAADAEARYAEAIKQAQAACKDLAAARGAKTYLATFDVGQAKVGRQQGFAGGRLSIEGRLPGTIQDTWAATDVLALAAKLLDEPVARKPRTHRGITRSFR